MIEDVQLLAPLRPDRIVALKSKYDEVRTLSRRAERIIDDTVEVYAKQLDEFIDDVEQLLDAKNDVSDKALQRMVLRLPVIMYRLSNLIDRSAIDSDIAKAATKNVYAKNYMDAEGTIPDKEAHATLATAEETLIVDLSRHVYSKLKAKFETANALFDGVRKVMSARDTEKQTFRRER